MVGTAQVRLCPPYALHTIRTVTCSVISRPRATRFSEVPPCLSRHRSALLAALCFLTATMPAMAQDIAMPREPQVGPRPFYLVDKMKDGPLKQQLSQCTGPFRKTDFSIGHRGAALEFPEHTRESYVAAARMGAGVIECDVTFTKDRELVCRHSQCDLHTTTNILTVPELAAKCSQVVQPGRYRDRQKSVGQVLHVRHHAGRIPPARGQDGRLQRRCKDAGGIPERHAALAHRSLRQFRHADDA